MDYLKKKELFKKYRDRKLTELELNVFLQLTESGELDEVYDQIIAELENEESQEIILPQPGSKMRVEKRLDREIAKQNTAYPYKWVMQIAAAAAVVFICIGGYRYLEYQQFVKDTETYTLVNVPVGKMKMVTLIDGTHVTLTSGSQFKYPKAFQKNARKVFLLHGRGFFDVAKDKSKPFTVQGEKLATTALGTSFVVQNYKTYGYEKVSLYTGMVKIDQAGETGGPIILIPGQEYEKDMGHNQNLVSTFPVTKDKMTNGKFEFNNDRLDVVLYNIASFYNAKLKFNAEDLKGQLITGTFEYTDINETLQSIAYTHHLLINKIDHSTYSIYVKKQLLTR